MSVNLSSDAIDNIDAFIAQGLYPSRAQFVVVAVGSRLDHLFNQPETLGHELDARSAAVVDFELDDVSLRQIDLIIKAPDSPYISFNDFVFDAVYVQIFIIRAQQRGEHP